MNPATDPIYAGIAGLKLVPESFNLGEGLVLSQTYAHFMAPFLMAFGPAKPGAPHPAPWSAVSGGITQDIHVQLYVPTEFDAPSFFDRLNTVWWIAALIRLRTTTRAHVPVLSDRPFRDVPLDWKNARLLPVEVLPRRLAAESTTEGLADADLQWIKRIWRPGGELMNRSELLNEAFQALDSAFAMPTTSVSLLAMWGALELVFCPAKQELRFRVAANIAAYLEAPGSARLELHRRVLKLYDARSEAAHGARPTSDSAWVETTSLVRRILIRILEASHVPTRQDLDHSLFGV